MTDLEIIEEALKDAWRVEFVPPVLPGVVKYTIYYESADVFREWVAETRRLRAALQFYAELETQPVQECDRGARARLALMGTAT